MQEKLKSNFNCNTSSGNFDIRNCGICVSESGVTSGGASGSGVSSGGSSRSVVAVVIMLIIAVFFGYKDDSDRGNICSIRAKCS